MNAHAQETAYQPEGPQPLLRQIAPGAAYPTQALGPLEAVAQAVQGQTLAPIAIAAQSALSVAALAVQGFADVETLGGTRPTSLYCLTIAKSGERKSACDAPLMSALKDFERTQGIAQADAVESWKNAHALWDVQRKKILNDSKSPKSEKRTGAQADLDALGPEPAAPPLPDRTVSEPTFEGLTRLYANGMPSLGIFSDEGGQFLGGHAMMSENRQKTLAALNDLWQGNPIKRTREGDGAYTLWGRRLSVHLMVQPGVARAFMADPQTSDTGFLARFLITEPPSAMGTRLQAKVARDPLALAAFSARLRAILETDLPIDEKNGALTPRILALSPEARDHLCAFADAIEVETAPTARLATLTGTASKVAEQACRIAGVLTLWADLNAQVIEAETMASGIDLAQFYLGEALRLADAATVSAETQKAEALRLWLKTTWPTIAARENRSPDKILPRDVVQHGPNALRETPKAKAALVTLAAHNWVTQLPVGTDVDGSNRTLAYQIEGAADVL